MKAAPENSKAELVAATQIDRPTGLGYGAE